MNALLYRKTLWLLLPAILLAGLRSEGQTPRQTAINELKAVYRKYQETPFLGFLVNYRYALEQNPGVFLDSLSGKFKLHHSNYWYELDSTETIANERMVVMLFKADDVMMLNKPSNSIRTLNPVALLDSLLLSDSSVDVSMQSGATTKKITLVLPQGSRFKKLEYFINNQSGFVTKATCLAAAEQMYEDALQSFVVGKSFAYIEIRMSNYTTGGFGLGQFDTDKYYQKQGGTYTVKPAFSRYKIFLGSANL